MRSSRSAGSCASRAVRSPRGPTATAARANRLVAARTVSDAHVTNQVRDLAWTVDHEGVRRMIPEGIYGRRKMTALVRRTTPDASPGSVDRAMRSLGLQGIRRSKGIRTTIPAKDGKRAGYLLDRDFTAGTEPDLGHGLHLLPHLGRVGLRRVRHRRLLPPDRRLASVPKACPPTWPWMPSRWRSGTATARATPLHRR